MTSLFQSELVHKMTRSTGEVREGMGTEGGRDLLSRAPQKDEEYTGSI